MYFHQVRRVLHPFVLQYYQPIKLQDLSISNISRGNGWTLLRFSVQIVGKGNQKFKYTFWIGVVRLVRICPKSHKIFQGFRQFCWFLGKSWSFILALVMCCFRIILKYMFFRSNIYTYIKHYTCKYPCLDVIQKIEYHNVARISLLQK